MPISNPVDVSHVTVLMDWTFLGAGPRTLVFYMINTGADPVTMMVDVSELPPSVDSDKRSTVTIPAGEQGSIEIGPYAVRSNFRLTAQTDSPAFPTAAVRWGVKIWFASL